MITFYGNPSIVEQGFVPSLQAAHQLVVLPVNFQRVLIVVLTEEAEQAAIRQMPVVGDTKLLFDHLRLCVPQLEAKDIKGLERAIKQDQKLSQPRIGTNVAGWICSIADEASTASGGVSLGSMMVQIVCAIQRYYGMDS